MAIKAVIFDIDNTMYDYNAGDKMAKVAVRNYCVDVLGLESELFERTYRDANRLMVRRIGYCCSAVHNRLIRFQCMMELMGKPLFPHARNMYGLYWDTLLESMKPEPGLMGFLELLREKGIQIGVGTNMTAYVQYKKLEKLGIGNMIDWLVTSEECGVEKPAPGFFGLCVEKSGLEPEECLFIGDSLEGDVLGAKAFGLSAVWYSRLVKKDAECPVEVNGFNSFLGIWEWMML